MDKLSNQICDLISVIVKYIEKNDEKPVIAKQEGK